MKKIILITLFIVLSIVISGCTSSSDEIKFELFEPVVEDSGCTKDARGFENLNVKDFQFYEDGTLFLTLVAIDNVNLYKINNFDVQNSPVIFNKGDKNTIKVKLPLNEEAGTCYKQNLNMEYKYPGFSTQYILAEIQGTYLQSFTNSEETKESNPNNFEDQIKNLFDGSDETLIIRPNSITINKGQSKEIIFAIRNSATDGKSHLFSYYTGLTNTEGINTQEIMRWITPSSGSFEVSSFGIEFKTIKVNIPENAPLGTYRFEITLDVDYNEGDSKANFIIRVV